MRRISQAAPDRSSAVIPAPRALLVAAVVLAVFGAQLLGLIHRIEHGGATQGRPALAWQAVDRHADEAVGALGESALADRAAGADDPRHDCAAIDALTTDAGLPGAGLALLPAAPPAGPPVAVVEPEPRRRTASHYCARAPPAFS
jgi:hypothetical protein